MIISDNVKAAGATVEHDFAKANDYYKNSIKEWHRYISIVLKESGMENAVVAFTEKDGKEVEGVILMSYKYSEDKTMSLVFYPFTKSGKVSLRSYLSAPTLYYPRGTNTDTLTNFLEKYKVVRSYDKGNGTGKC